MKSPPAPTPPDPKETAAAQAGMNVDTAQAQMLTNMVNQNTPQGSVSYDRTGTTGFRNSSGQWVEIPNYTATTTYSPEQQRLYDLSNATEQKIGEIGLAQAGKIGDLLGTPININNEETEARLYELGSKRLDPQFARQQADLETKLANQGVRVGSAAYSAAMNDFNQGKNDAYNQLILTGRGQAVQEMMAERNQPINEISALLSQSQVSQPNFINAPQAPVGGVDYTGLVNEQYKAKMAAWQQQVASKNAMMGGMFGLIGSGLTMFSDRRLKKNIEKVGKIKGLNVYEFDYKAGGPRQMGFMAQEVEKKNPDAVVDVGGFKAVDYGKAVEAH